MIISQVVVTDKNQHFVATKYYLINIIKQDLKTLLNSKKSYKKIKNKQKQKII
jgi:predicted component of type VI protein secretion system